MTELNARDLEQGFTRPMRTKVRHTLCNFVSELRTVDALDFAVHPGIPVDAYCLLCGHRYPVAQFTWLQDGEIVGS